MNGVGLEGRDAALAKWQTHAGLGERGGEGRLTSAEVIERLEEAGSTLLALPSGGYSTKLKTRGCYVLS